MKLWFKWTSCWDKLLVKISAGAQSWFSWYSIVNLKRRLAVRNLSSCRKCWLCTVVSLKPALNYKNSFSHHDILNNITVGSAVSRKNGASLREILSIHEDSLLQALSIQIFSLNKLFYHISNFQLSDRRLQEIFTDSRELRSTSNPIPSILPWNFNQVNTTFYPFFRCMSTVSKKWEWRSFLPRKMLTSTDSWESRGCSFQNQ